MLFLRDDWSTKNKYVLEFPRSSMGTLFEEFAWNYGVVFFTTVAIKKYYLRNKNSHLFFDITFVAQSVLFTMEKQRSRCFTVSEKLPTLAI